MKKAGQLQEGVDENPNKDLKLSKRISRKEQLMLPGMWRQILFMSLYQILVMLILMYFGGLMFFEESFNLVTAAPRDPVTLAPRPRLQLDSMIFHTYILMNLFNAINCRVVDPDEKNVFKTLLNNPLFWLVTGLEVAAQLGMLWLGSFNGLGSILLGTTGLTPGMQITSWVLGASVLAVNVGIKFIPLEQVQKLPYPKNLENEEEHAKGGAAQLTKGLRDGYAKKRDEVLSQSGA